MVKFCHFDLRTTDVGGARAFYTRLLGHDRATIWPLHEQALARGARPHWLGNLGVPDVERVAAAFVERGAVPLGPPRPNADGGQTAVLRDPGGAVVAVSTPPRVEVDIGVVWHVLNTGDATRARAIYRELFGWDVDRGAHGSIHAFSWEAGGPSAGAIADVAGRPGVHPHWLFFFEVDDLEAAMAVTREAGGVVVERVVLPGGEHGCVCDDPQGAAFALRERSS